MDDILPDSVHRRARSLSSLGLEEVAWSKRDALVVLEEIDGLAVAVLGGDVYRISGEELVPTYDNWSCGRELDESAVEFADRSRRVAVGYIDSHSVGEEAFFALVLEFGQAIELSRAP